jgi:hypothetical protein
MQRYTNIFEGVPQAPALGEVQTRRDSHGFVVFYQTGAPFYVVTGHGKSEAEAIEHAKAKAAELRGETCPLCTKPLNGELYFHGECGARENADAEVYAEVL